MKANPIRAFITANPIAKGRPCKVCMLPEVSFVNDAYAPGTADHVGVPDILRALQDQFGHKSLTSANLKNHFQDRHHIPGQRRTR